MMTRVPSLVQQVSISLQELLQIEHCPAEWRALDLYVFRDGEVVFYVGQSYLAFDRVWMHILDGFKGRSVVGRFLLCNWPVSMHFCIDFYSSRHERFTALGGDLDAAERSLIEEMAPCFNATLNREPTPLPGRYRPPTAPLRSPRSPSRLIREAAYALQARQRRAWLDAEP